MDGVAVRDPKGRYRVSNTLSLRLRKVETKARRRWMAILLGEGS